MSYKLICDFCQNDIDTDNEHYSVEKFPWDKEEARGDLDFCSLTCLSEWAGRMIAAMPVEVPNA